MRAAVIREYGGLEVLRVEDMPAPEPGGGEVLVRVRASSINPIDWKIRQGQLKWVQGWRFPRILGFDLCGEVVETGDSGSRFQIGDTVYARSDRPTGEAHAEMVVTSEESLAPAPESLSVEEAATIPLAGLTALQALRDLGGLQAAERTLILGASGGVGSFAVQIAKALGAEVTGVCGPDNLDFVRQLGADSVLDYRRQEVTEAHGGFSVIFDAVAAYGFYATRPLLTPEGVYVSTLPGPAVLFHHVLANRFLRQKAYLIWVKPRGRDLDFLSQLAAAGKLRSHIDSQYRLEQIRSAHERSETGRVRGKISVLVS